MSDNTIKVGSVIEVVSPKTDFVPNVHIGDTGKVLNTRSELHPIYVRFFNGVYTSVWIDEIKLCSNDCEQCQYRFKCYTE
jgi:hypothetical protein